MSESNNSRFLTFLVISIVFVLGGVWALSTGKVAGVVPLLGGIMAFVAALRERKQHPPQA